MAYSGRNIPFFVKRSSLRFSSDNSASRFWEIVPKQWRTPRFHNPDENSLSQKMSPSTKTVRFVDKLNPFLPPKIYLFKRNPNDEQRGLTEVVDEESKQKGLSVVIAQYLVFSGAKVKFSKIPEWIDCEENYDKLPKVHEMGNSLIGIDISYTDLGYAGLKPLTDLPNVKFFYAEGCKEFDDYCLDFISAHLPSLEELDLRHCRLITSRGLGVLYRFKNLRKLQLDGVESDAELELMCVLLEEYFPNIKIEGITYQADKSVQTE